MDADIGCTPPSQRDDRCNLRIIDAKGLAAPRDHDRLAWKTRPNFLQVIHCQPFDDRTGLHCCGRWAIVGEAGRDDHLVSHLAKQGASFHAGVLGRRESTRTVQIEHYRLVVVRSVLPAFFYRPCEWLLLSDRRSDNQQAQLRLLRQEEIFSSHRLGFGRSPRKISILK